MIGIAALKIGMVDLTHFIICRFSNTTFNILIVSNPTKPIIDISTSLLGRARPFAHDP